MVYIYVLKLSSDKYYVGKSNNPVNRISDHVSGEGSAWTTMYKPIEIIEVIPDCDDYDEDKYTLKYMGQYGIDNVRGGSFCQIKLKKKRVALIETMLAGSNDLCYECGKEGHFAKECPTTMTCKRCNRNGHLKRDCYAKTYADGSYIKSKNKKYPETDKDSLICMRCDRYGHLAVDCFAESDKNGNDIGIHCYRCGRSGHWRVNCYEKTDKNGKVLTNDDNFCMIQ